MMGSSITDGKHVVTEADNVLITDAQWVINGLK
jgi:hypothetical protein